MRPGVIVAVVLVAACGGRTDDVPLVISAASSLGGAFEEIIEAFEAGGQRGDIVLNLAGSSTLREQVLSGAPADVFASANHEIMDELAEAGMVSERTVFATNRLVLAVAPGNPAGVDGLGALADPDVFVGVCAPQVPCGSLAREVLAVASVTPSVDTEEPDVASLATKLEEGELDAGLVYVTDAVARGLDFFEVASPIVEYPVAVVEGARSPRAAGAFIDHLGSPESRRILERYGFGTP